MERRIALDEQALVASERLAAYDMANAILTVQLAIQNAFSLRAEEAQVFLLIVLATVQRFVRQAQPGDALLDNRPLPDAVKGGISRRRLADVSGIPFETVRRHVQSLQGRGLVTERRRGQLATTGGVLARLSQAGITLRAAQQFQQAANGMVRTGAFRIRSGRGSA
jgi:DNA-binding transcriptional ArsR family regulator